MVEKYALNSLKGKTYVGYPSKGAPKGCCSSYDIDDT
jgi:hypothetical protein